jgi:hypothetical protein
VLPAKAGKARLNQLAKAICELRGLWVEAVEPTPAVAPDGVQLRYLGVPPNHSDPACTSMSGRAAPKDRPRQRPEEPDLHDHSAARPDAAQGRPDRGQGEPIRSRASGQRRRCPVSIANPARSMLGSDLPVRSLSIQAQRDPYLAGDLEVFPGLYHQRPHPSTGSRDLTVPSGGRVADGVEDNPEEAEAACRP